LVTAALPLFIGKLAALWRQLYHFVVVAAASLLHGGSLTA
jgi:hypothetical protein